MRSQRFNVGQAPPTLLVDQGAKVSNENVTVRNTHATQPVDLGDGTVVTGAGYELKAGEVYNTVLGPGDKLYAVSGAGLTTPVEVIFTYTEGGS